MISRTPPPPSHPQPPPYKHMFLHVPCRPPVESRKRPALHVRSHTFCATFRLNRESAIWGVCPQMAISDTCRHVPDTFLHVPCPCLQFRNLPSSIMDDTSRSTHLQSCTTRLDAVTLNSGGPSHVCVVALWVPAASAQHRTAHLPIMSRKLTFPCILCSPRIGWLKLRPLSIRYFTFRATLPFNP